ncbi:Asp-tRNA(Asn)/Glu-tRNA(Gln) amidotransferase subunit GatB [Schlesneria sp. DSM 10557]|uniref:Asp-tRNA(Asn)/Glu-tRNA(Gln) amidotransferase subunit GatB n=1 Tax=Schlesneria sp. DSM 10557 TaxID=3044399 RepID=UPI0035A1C5DA
MSYEIIIGLEIHVQLQTKTKIFCGCPTTFNPDHPNVQTCPVCLGLPGALPVLNQHAYHLGVKTALGLGCQIAPFTKWDRKQYFYPDLPKGYQISQFDLPFSHDGHVDVVCGDPATVRRVRILRAHLEEDAGKNTHDESGRGRDSKVDLNRAGTPLVEIVTEPDLRSSEEARRFLEELRLMLTYLEVSDCNMQEGSLRCDANINLHVLQPDGTKVPTPIVEIKNLNSFRFTEQAIDYEVARQWEAYQQTGIRMGAKSGHKRTVGFDPGRGVTYALREKEEAADYRYFPDPDLVPVTTTVERVDAIRAEMCELPGLRRQRLIDEYQLTPYDASVIIDQGRAVADYFEDVAKACGEGKQAANWLTQDLQAAMKERGETITTVPIRPPVLAALLKRINQKQITIKAAREVFAALLSDHDEEIPVTESRIDEIVKARGLAIVQDTGAIDAAIAAVIERSAKAIADFKSGNEKAIGAMIGQVMKGVKGADPQLVREKLLEAIARS